MSTNKFHSDNSHKSILKSTSILSVGTLSSRILGFIRDVLLARLLGTGMRADAFFVAFKIPNLFRAMVGEGATNAAVVPIFSEYLQREQRQSFWDLVNIVFSWALIILSSITLLGILGAPFIVRLIAPGFIADSQKLHLAIRLTKLIFPYLILISLTAYSMGFLYTFRSFTAPAFSPCLLNISIITCIYFASRHTAEPTLFLACGVLIGGLLQFLVQLKPMMKTGFRFKWPKTLYHPGASKIGKLLIPRMLGSGVYQLTILVDTLCASLSAIVGLGGVSAIYYANRLVQFPMGLFSNSIATAALPTLSGFATAEDTDSFRKTLIFSLENVIFIMCPIIVVCLFLSTSIVRILFERGVFSEYSTSITSSALLFYSLGLISFGGVKILVSAFHARQDTKTPVQVAGLCLVINTILNFALMGKLKVGGIALASSIAGTVNFLILLILLDKQIGEIKKTIGQYLFKILGSTIVAAGAGWCALMEFHAMNEILRLVIVSGVIFIVFQGICLILHVKQAKGIWRVVTRRVIAKSLGRRVFRDNLKK